MGSLGLILLFILAFLPPIIYAIWIRNTEKNNRERWIPILLCFLWGATIAIIASITLEVILNISLVLTLSDHSNLSLILVVFIAPFAEELTKPLALSMKTVKKELQEPEDGLIYGAVAGLGFSATENLFYGVGFFSEGMLFFIIFMLIRSFGGCLLHASATALTGYGYGQSILKGRSLLRVLPYIILAMILHGLYNLLVSIPNIGFISGLFFALIFVAIAIILVRKKIRTLDNANT